VTPPVNVFARLNVNLPVPSFTKEPPVPSTTTPTSDAVLPSIVSTFPCRFTVPVPDAVKTPIVSLHPNFKLPLVSNVTVVPSPIADPPLTVNVPPFTFVFPVYVFAPPNVNSPAPAFVNANAPPNAPDITTPLAAVRVVSAVNVPAPLHVSVPFFGPSPMVTLPPKLYEFTKVRFPVGEASVLRTVTPDIATEPNPNA
jgi:hypothetical protein